MVPVSPRLYHCTGVHCLSIVQEYPGLFFFFANLLLVLQEDGSVEVGHVLLRHLEHQVVLAGVGHVPDRDDRLWRTLVLQGAQLIKRSRRRSIKVDP